MAYSQPHALSALFAWLPMRDPQNPGIAVDALPGEAESLAYHDDDPRGFCSYVEFLADAMDAFGAEGSDEGDAAPAPLMIMVTELPGGGMHQLPEDIAIRLTQWAEACLEELSASSLAIGGIGLRLSQSISGIAYAFPGHAEWEIAGTMEMDALPDVPAAE